MCNYILTSLCRRNLRLPLTDALNLLHPQADPV